MPARVSYVSQWAKPCLIVLIYMMIVSLPVTAKQKREWREAQAEVVVTGVSPEYAERQAFDMARARALGIQEVSEIRVLSQRETDSAFVESFRQRRGSRTYGHIVKEDTLLNQTLVNGDTQLIVRRVRIRVLVVYDEVQGKSPYEVQVRILPRTRFEAGDSMVVEVDLKETSYLHIFNITADDRVIVLYPLDMICHEPIPGGSSFVFPNDGSILRVAPLPGHIQNHEEIRVVATKEPLRFFAGDLSIVPGGGQYLDLKAMDLTTLETEIVGIPFEERAEATAEYDVYSREENR